MSDTGSIQFTASQASPSTSGKDGSVPLSILELPEGSTPRTNSDTTIRGKIVREDRDGTLHIRTDQGNVKAKPERTTNLREGDQVEIRVERNSDGTQSVNIRTAPREVETVRDAPSTAPQTQAPQNLNLPPTLTRTELQSAPPIQVTPLAPKQLLNVVQPYIETVASTVTNIPNLNQVLTQPLIHTTETAGLIQGAAVTQPPLTTTASFFDTALFTSTDSQSSPLTAHIQIPNSNVLSLPVLEGEAISLPIESLNVPLTPVSRITEISIEQLHVPPVQFLPQTDGEDIYSLRPEKVEHGIFTQATDIIQPRAGETHAILVGLTPDKHFPVFEITSDGYAQHYVLQSPIEALPAGTQIELHAIQNSSLTPIAPPISAAISLTPAYFLTSETWQIMQEVQQTLAQANPQTAQVFNNLIPNAGTPANMGPTMLFFIAAIRSGDLQGWMGDKVVDALKRAGKGDLLGRLGREFSALSRFSSEPVHHDWRGLSVPLSWQNEIHKIAVHYRKEENTADDGIQNAGTKTRFIMDLSLSQMGSVQLDGLYQGREDGNMGRLDLILRTEESFSAAMKQTMRSTYKNALDETALTGELSFQDQQEQWVKISPDLAKSEFSQNI